MVFVAAQNIYFVWLDNVQQIIIIIFMVVVINSRLFCFVANTYLLNSFFPHFFSGPFKPFYQNRNCKCIVIFDYRVINLTNNSFSKNFHRLIDRRIELIECFGVFNHSTIERFGKWSQHILFNKLNRYIHSFTHAFVRSFTYSSTQFIHSLFNRLCILLLRYVKIKSERKKKRRELCTFSLFNWLGIIDMTDGVPLNFIKSEFHWMSESV